ncbi:hypothetical protein AKJ64_01695 [candidate division MSBL1 archaeon SCGC-AAA259E17]|uniref:Transposase IS4-like domain-containing protein n=1 Tax=candidate division MSBL1 archaeon SCGC-AAA259E17 TaxID=1698263 RepID=A0A133UFK0_9EURY|nr:hypothetical protein AKJ64_01695 [candidate division MSBL1 archaeon SCGC-AAA259E17]
MDILTRGRYSPQKVEDALGKNKRLFDYDFKNGLSYRIDKERWDYERTIAGKFLLVTTTDLNSWDVMVAYKNLKDVERAFDELKNLLKLRPIFHRTNKRVKPHVFVCYLALLTKRLITEGSYSNKRLGELKSLKVHELNADDEVVWMRNETTYTQQKILEATDEVMEQVWKTSCWAQPCAGASRSGAFLGWN